MGVRLVVWKGVLWVCFVKGVFLGYLDEFFLGRVIWCEIGASDGFFLVIFEWTPAG